MRCPWLLISFPFHFQNHIQGYAAPEENSSLFLIKKTSLLKTPGIQAVHSIRQAKVFIPLNLSTTDLNVFFWGFVLEEPNHIKKRKKKNNNIYPSASTHTSKFCTTLADNIKSPQFTQNFNVAMKTFVRSCRLGFPFSP